MKPLNSPFFLLLLLSVIFGCQENKPEKKPNVILILTDDQGYGDLGIHGNELVKTPNLDRMGASAARFDRFYVSPLCAPTRASILTGRYHLRTGTISVSNGLETMDAEENTLGELFKENGYRTGIFGKWHNGQHYPHHPLAQGFDEFTGFLAGHWSNYFDTQVEQNREMKVLPGYLPDVLTDETLNFIEANQEQPFFALLTLNTPHSPHQVPDEYFDPYKVAGLDDELAAVYGMVSNIDYNVGRVMEKLKTLGLEENTLIIFLTDNGPNGNRYNAGMKGIKGSVHEGGVRVPSFWYWPGQLSAQLIPFPASHIDILPTLVDLLDLKDNGVRTLDGISLLPSLQGKDQTESRPIFSHVAFPQRSLTSFPGAIRRDSLLLAILPTGMELYDLKNDPGQQLDLAVQRPDLAEGLAKQYQDWWTGVKPEETALRPIPISRQSPEILLAAYEARFGGQIKFFEGHGWAQDWVTNWVDEADTLSWELNVIDPGDYEVWLDYTADPEQTGAKLNLIFPSGKLESSLSEAFQPALIPSPDRVPRKEAPEQTWNRISLGTVNLQNGPQRLQLSANAISKAGLGDIYGIRLSPVSSPEK